MDITIGHYRVTSDPLNFKVEERYEKKDGQGEVKAGEYSYRFVGYYSNFEHLINKILERDIKISDAENLSEILEIFRRYKKEVIDMVAHIDSTIIKQYQQDGEIKNGEK